MGTLAAGAGAASTTSMVFGGLSTGLKAIGQVESGKGQAQQYLYQAQVATNNAVRTRANAAQDAQAGSYVESARKMETGQLIASQKVAQAANGIDLAVGSAPAVRDSAASLGAMDSAVLHFNAAKMAYGAETEARDLETQAELYRTAAKNSKKVGNAAALSTVISGASALGSKWSAYKQSGAQ